jgi:hypothetical protein
MKPYQERVVQEKKELDERMERLRQFIGTDAFDALDHDEQVRLEKQLDVMHDYSGILAERIAASFALAWVKDARAALSEKGFVAADFVAEVDAAVVARLTAERDKFAAALNQIASWSEGANVTGSFDEPHSARIARAALAPTRKEEA